MKQLLFVLILFSSFSNAQDARHLLREVNTKFASVKDYQADVNIRTAIPFIRMMPVNARLFFKQPDKFRLKSKGIAILPRQSFDQLFKNLRDTNSYMPVAQSQETIHQVKTQIISILPVSDTADLVLGKLWIDTKEKLILRSQVTTKSNGTVTTDFYFGNHTAQALPDSMLFTIDTRKFKIPKAVAADLNNVKSTDKSGKNELQKGQIIIRFKDYQINKGIADEIFR